jgi:3-oxoacyl-[acyl-carrier protein] reductase
MDFGIKGKWALVCASSKGLGLGCAQALAAEGVNIIMNGRDASTLGVAAKTVEEAARAAGHMNVQVKPVVCDVTTPAGRELLLAAAPQIDILVNNAGGPPTGDFRKFTRDDWIKAIDANMLTPIELIKALVDGMAARGFGRIVNITSSAVKHPIDILGLSNGARTGLTGFIGGVSRSSIAASNVTINNLLPGRFLTDRLKGNFEVQAKNAALTPEKMQETSRGQIPARRFGTPEEFGHTCAYLCSQQASYMTGQNILMDGGLLGATF